MGELHRIPQASGAAERAFADGGLTGRERDAARSVLAGMTAQAAASVMGVDAETVASYRRRAYRKLGVADARGLVARLGERGAGDGRDWRPALRERGLSDTQAEVLARVAAGRSSSEIAGELHLAPGTVSSARANGYRLLGVHSREGLLAELEAGESAGRGRAGAPARRRASRLAAACVAAAVLLALLVVGGEALLTAAAQKKHPWFSADGTYHPELVPFTALDSRGDELFGVSENGQRFGRLDFVAAYMGGIADLYAARGADGTMGYVHAQEPDAGTGRDGDALYDKDGVTVIGEGALRTDRFFEAGQPVTGKTAFTAFCPDGAELFGINEQGQSFGSQDIANLYLGGNLDLVKAHGMEGTSGYVLQDELEAARGGDEIRVYLSDGLTQIDLFLVDG